MHSNEAVIREIGHDQFRYLAGGEGGCNVGPFKYFKNVHADTSPSLCFALQNTKATTTDLGVTTTSSLMDHLPLRLSLRPSRPTSWALAREPSRDRATIPQTTKGSRT